MNGVSGEYIPVSLSVLKSGMNINYSIFRENNREFLLLCKDQVLTDDLIERFKRLTYPNYVIYMPRKKYDEIQVDKRKQQQKAKKNAFVKSYEQVKNVTSIMMDKIAAEDNIPVEVADELTKTVHKQVEVMEITHIIESINSVRMVDEYLHTHSVNVAMLNGIIGRWLKMDTETLTALVKVGLLHDIGKLKIPQEILDKPTRLTEEEFKVIINHPVFSRDILVKSGFTDERILLGVAHHHERTNGMGYPFGLNANTICDFARITAISDVYDAMVANRAYKVAHSPFEILSWFAEGCYSELDFKYVSVFLESMTEEFKGKSVLLSDDRVGTIMFFNNHNIAYPLVQMRDGSVVTTSEEVKCVRIIEDFDDEFSHLM